MSKGKNVGIAGEKRVLVDKALDALDEFKLISILRNLIMIPGYNGHEDRKADYVLREMERRDLEIVENYIDVERNRRNVIGILRGEGTGKTLMLCAHHDTRWPHDGESGQHEARVEDDMIYGLGTGDSMPPTAVMFAVVDAIKRANIKLKGDLILLSSADEMCFKDGARILEENGIKADYCIMGEATDFNIGVVHSGKAEVEITTRGRLPKTYDIAVFAERMGEHPVNAILSMNTIINYLRRAQKEDPFFQQTHPLLPGKGAAINFGTIIGGSRGDGDPTKNPGRGENDFGLAKRVPTWCKMRVGARHWPGQTAEEYRDTIQKWVDKAKEENPDIDATVELYLDHGNDPFVCPEDAEIVGIMRKVIKHSIDKDPDLVGMIFSSEGPFYQRAGMEFVYCCPPSRGSIGEYITKEELMKLARIWTAAAVYCTT